MTLLPTTAVWMNLAEYGATGTMFLCAALLWCRRHENRKQRILQAAAFVMGGAWLLSHLLTTCKAGMPESYPLLPVLPLYGGCWFLLFLLLYPAEAIRPGMEKRMVAIPSGDCPVRYSGGGSCRVPGTALLYRTVGIYR